jgi:hypothetical protein
MSAVSVEERFLFDLQGFLLLREVLTPSECAEFRELLARLEAAEYADPWQAALPPGPPGRPTKETGQARQVRLNGLPRLDPAFDVLIDHPRVLPYLQEFVGLPQLINTWSIAKWEGARPGGWHRGVPPTDYSCRGGEIRSRMLNVVYFLTDNGPEDGCMVALPGSHKNGIDLPWQQYPGLTMPGALAVTGRAGDAFLFSEAVLHDGLPKSTSGVRANLYYNYVHAHYNVMTREPRNCHHFYFPPAIRDRFTPERRALTAWMEFTRWEY